jgi:hypothetical protein
MLSDLAGSVDEIVEVVIRKSAEVFVTSPGSIARAGYRMSEMFNL